ncbi:MAG: hypothetical protein IJX62_01265, partial [Clostridia bacterium]|nr:hypothetical protein [Clostridia bacterium]
TRQFKRTLLAVSAASALFLLWFAVFGKGLAVSHFQGVLDAILVVMALAAGSFLAFSFLPYFHGDKRWYSISALLTVVFFAGAVMLWQAPVTGVILA